MTRRPDGGNAPSPIVDTAERTFWPALSAPRQNFGANMAAGLPGERFKRACRQQLRWLLVRCPKNCSCAFGLWVAFTGGAPESVRSMWVSTERAERSPRKVQRRSASAEHSSALPR